MPDEESITSHDLITNDLVKEALKNDEGQEAEVISWEIKDFTKKGDNFASYVTSIEVKFKKNELTYETSYVVKLNPRRPISYFNDVLEVLNSHEGIVLCEIADGLNKQLKNLNLPPIKFPKLYARNLETRKQVLINENLRKQGFKMHDRTKVMDVHHALMVVEELGRLHASSLLYEETLAPKTIPECFDYFVEPWSDFSHPSFKTFSAMIAGQCKTACSVLEKVPEYQKCFKWLTDKLDCMGKYFIEDVFPSKKFDILSHGDCWTNNMLFKYDEEENPVDIKLLDLQMSKKSSPACDLNYFYYTSLNGEVRQKHSKTMEKEYYKSFSKVLELAGKEPPFTFSEFESEMIARKRFGLVAGLLVLPVVLAEGDEIMDIDNVDDDNMEEFLDLQSAKFARMVERKSFKDRFLSMFDEMIEYKIFDD